MMRASEAPISLAARIKSVSHNARTIPRTSRMSALQVAICVSPVSYVMDRDLPSVGIHSINNAIITHTHTIPCFPTSQFHRLARPRFLSQLLKTCQNSCSDRARPKFPWQNRRRVK